MYAIDNGHVHARPHYSVDGFKYVGGTVVVQCAVWCCVQWESCGLSIIPQNDNASQTTYFSCECLIL